MRETLSIDHILATKKNDFSVNEFLFLRRVQ
jgi:hypothetical protein